MAVTKTRDSIAVNVVLNNGTYDGKVKTLSVNLGKLSTTNYDADKAMDVVELLEPCLSKELYKVQEVDVNSMEASA
ncbi:MAG: hypothetical protein IJR94_01545 [Synergistaceae bacterium]|nr:hypothetical protein [Synergistaceae bacterium]